MNIIIAIIVLSVIIIVHEFGHFILAKANGVMVLEFTLGFGPKLLHFKKGETEYSLKLLPFGGACIMLGEDFASEPSVNGETEVSANEENLKHEYDMNRSFANKSVWARMSILAAGPIFNFLLAFILSVFIIGFLGYDPARIDKVASDSPAASAGLMEGDVITEINGRDIDFSREYSLYTMFYPDKTENITYIRDSKKYTVTVVPKYEKISAYRVGITITMDCGVNSVEAGSPAEKAGLKINDVIRTVDGTELTSGDQLSSILSGTKDREVTMVVMRDGNAVSLNVTPTLVETESYTTGITSYGERVKASPLGTVVYSVKETGYWIRYVFDSLSMMLSGRFSLNDVAGPVGVVNVIGNVVEQSKPDGVLYVLLNIFSLTVMISANLGVMNLLPLPALDGGRLVFCIIEALRGKPVPREKEGMVHFVGMVLLMLFMVVILFNDLKNIFF